jgi:hypothetical protein
MAEARAFFVVFIQRTFLLIKTTMQISNIAALVILFNCGIIDAAGSIASSNGGVQNHQMPATGPTVRPTIKDRMGSWWNYKREKWSRNSLQKKASAAFARGDVMKGQLLQTEAAEKDKLYLHHKNYNQQLAASSKGNQAMPAFDKDGVDAIKAEHQRDRTMIRAKGAELTAMRIQNPNLRAADHFGIGGTNPPVHLFDVYEKINRGGNGITMGDLQGGVRSIIKDITDKQIEDMFMMADTDRNGIIDFNEFKSILVSSGYAPFALHC